jgi:hypothetical protein
VARERGSGRKRVSVICGRQESVCVCVQVCGILAGVKDWSSFCSFICVFFFLSFRDAIIFCFFVLLRLFLIFIDPPSTSIYLPPQFVVIILIFFLPWFSFLFSGWHCLQLVVEKEVARRCFARRHRVLCASVGVHCVILHFTLLLSHIHFYLLLFFSFSVNLSTLPKYCLPMKLYIFSPLPDSGLRAVWSIASQPGPASLGYIHRVERPTL